jgi:intracellular sulfur oxidation DsrE/DsrF family protein
MQRLLTLSPQVHVELVVNDEGLALLGSNSPLAQQIKQMSNQADRLRFVACKQSVERSRARGKSITLLPNVDTSHTALEEVMLRLEQGWHVIRV